MQIKGWGTCMSDFSNQEQRLDYLVENFIKEVPEYRRIRIPSDPEGKRRLLRSIMNVRDPKPASTALMAVQDSYLKARALEKGIVNVRDVATVRESLGSGHPFADVISIWQGDITRLAADAIVNAANSRMLGCFIPMHSCIDNCIHTYSGVQLRLECNRRMNSLRLEHGADYDQPVAVPMLTDAYNLPSKKIIHIVGPVVDGLLTPRHERDLADCYRNILDTCLQNELRSVAFCCISTGVFNFPKEKAAEIAEETVSGWLGEHGSAVDRVIFNVFSDEDRSYYETLLK